MTQLLKARAGETTPQMQAVARQEGAETESVRRAVARGTVVIPANRNHSWLEPAGIGEGLRIKVNANLGTSSSYPSPEMELEKLRVAIEAKADAVMDLSTSGDLNSVRRMLLRECPLPFGTVPIYQVAVEAHRQGQRIGSIAPELFFQAIEQHAQDGVDFATVHCGLTRAGLEALHSTPRTAGIVSRGGAILACWMTENDRENPLYEKFDRILEIALRYDLTLSLGDALRPGCLADASDRAQIQELIVLGGLVERARAAGVQAMVEGPGHLPMDQIAANVVMQKQVCHGAPFYVLGPVVSDIAPGWDHLTSAIGGALAGMAGADFLCYVTPSEHLGLPELEDVRQGVVAARVAAHAADLVRLGARARAQDDQMAQARAALDWERQFELALDPQLARRIHGRSQVSPEAGCSMCGEFCPFRLQEAAKP